MITTQTPISFICLSSLRTSRFQIVPPRREGEYWTASIEVDNELKCHCLDDKELCHLRDELIKLFPIDEVKK